MAIFVLKKEKDNVSELAAMPVIYDELFEQLNEASSELDLDSYKDQSFNRRKMHILLMASKEVLSARKKEHSDAVKKKLHLDVIPAWANHMVDAAVQTD